MKQQIRILNGTGLVVGAFGGSLGRAGLSWPADVLLVRPEFSGERYDHESTAAAWLVVADRVGERIQVYETDGTFVGTVGKDAHRADTPSDGAADRSGWPFFRVPGATRLGAPVGLTWRAPFLDVTTADGDLVSVDLAYALLPTFDVWLSQAGVGELAAARRFFRQRQRCRSIGTARQMAVDTMLGQRLLEARQYAQATAVWEAELPRDTVDSTTLRAVVRERLAVVSRCAFRLGHYGPLAATAAPLRLQLASLAGASSGEASAIDHATPQPSSAALLVKA